MLTTAVLLATKILFTGVVSLVPSAKDPHLVRVVVPNGMASGIPKMPPHFAYLMFDMKQLDPSGRQPSFTLMDGDRTFGVSLIEGEYLEISGTFERQPQQPLCQPTISSFQLSPCANATGSTSAAFPAVEGDLLLASDESLHWLFDFGQANENLAKKIDTTLLGKQPDATHVLLRMDLRLGKLATAAEHKPFDLRYAYRVSDNGKCQALSKAVGVTLESSEDATTLVIRSTPFEHAKEPKPPLILSVAGDDLIVLVGNEPIDAIQESIDFLDPDRPRSDHHHEDTTNHLQLMQQLLINGRDLHIPGEIPAGACQGGMSPAASGGATGGSGACNPSGMPAADPASNGG